MENAVQVMPQSGGTMSLKQVADRVNIVHQVLKTVMKKGTHFGVVPGCGNKNVLLKPGADVLAMTFQLVPQFQVTKTDMENGHREFDVTCSMYAANGVLLGQGVGSCSTMEKKYRYRNVDGKRVENEDIADVYNTVLKMAKKRAHIDATLTVTGAGDLFTQDLIEDEDEPKKEPIKMPVEKTTVAEETVTGKVESVETVNSKPDAAKPWTKWGIKINGDVYGTFDKSIGEAATVLEGCEAVLTWKSDGKHRNATSIKPA